MISRTCIPGLLLACALWCTQTLAKEVAEDILAFELTVQADDKDIAPWVAQHLQLQRYKSLSDLDDQEMDKLLRDADPALEAHSPATDKFAQYADHHADAQEWLAARRAVVAAT